MPLGQVRVTRGAWGPVFGKTRKRSNHSSLPTPARLRKCLSFSGKPWLYVRMTGWEDLVNGEKELV